MPGALCLTLLLAQTVTTPPESTDAAQIARIRKALAELPVLETRRIERDDRPVFRLEVTGRKPDKPLSDDLGVVPPYIRTPMPLYHHEFMSQVTPDFFRASVLYPGYPTTPYGSLSISVPLMPLFEATAKGLARIKRRRREEAAREEVRRAIEDRQRAKDQKTVPRDR